MSQRSPVRHSPSQAPTPSDDARKGQTENETGERSSELSRDSERTAQPETDAGQPSLGSDPSKSAPDDEIDPENGASGEVYTGSVGPGLHVVSTPIGNLGDMTVRAIATLRQVDVIACEDTRVTGVLLRRFGITTPMTPYHDHNAERVRPRLISQLGEGKKVALVSDAGTPLLSDPGFKFVQACVDANIPVVPVPGASAMLSALVTAALPTDRVLFSGFLPPKSGARQRALEEVKAINATLVFYETGPRLADSLADMASVLGPRMAAVCRELTKRHEEIRRNPLDALAAHYAEAGAPRGEIVIVIGGAPPVEAASEADIDTALRDALKTASVRDAATQVATQLNQPRRVVYARALVLNQDNAD